ncbi:MAG: 50S ribosomal protein L29 [Bacteroidota bacterium]
MKVSEIRELTTPELLARLKDEKDKLVKFRLNHAVSAIERPSDITDARRNIARLKTVIRERQLQE